MKKIFTISFLAIGIFLLSNPAQANTLTRIYLDEPTMTGPGYTVVHENLSLGIRGGIFSEGAQVVFKSVGMDAPDGWEYVAGPFEYDIQVSHPTGLSKPLWVSFDMAGYHPSNQVKAGYYLRNLDQWIILPTWVNDSQQYRTAIHIPYSTMALFERNVPIADQPNIPDVAAGAVLNRTTGEILWNRNGDSVRPIASISKLMTALVVLDTNPNWDREITWKSEYDREGARLYIQPGEQLTVKDLWYTMLVSSANNATIALARSTGMSEAAFVQKMNEKAQALGLNNTRFVEPTGLDVRNVSTAKEIANFSAEAFRHYEVLQGSTSKGYYFQTSTGAQHWLRNTNNLLYSPLYVTGSKTGWIPESGYNLVMQTRGPQGQESVAVVLGTSNKASREASEETLINWAYRAFDWK